MATPTTSDFLVVPINGTDLIAFYRGSNISRPLYLSYTNFLAILTQAIGGGTTLLLETNSVQNQSQAILNLIQGSGVTITDGGNGNITIAATGGTAFITSVSDTADIDLNVALSDLTATLTTTGVTANTYGSATQVPQITVDSKGRITGVTLVTITAGTGTVTNVSASVPSPTTPALSVNVTNPTTTPAIAITANGTTAQYVRGNGSLATFPTLTGYVPYTGATTDVNLGVHSFIANDGTYNTEMSPSYFGVENNAATIFALLEYNKLTLTNSVLPSVLEISATGITFPDLTVQTTAGVTSVGLTMPSAFSVASSPVTTSGTIAVTGAGTTSQYVRGDGTLATYNPGTGGGGASVSYYLNGSVSQGTFGGVAFKQMSKTAVFGAGTDFTINADGYIQSFITDAGTPNQLLIPAGNWNFETYFSASSSGGSPSFYVQIYKWDGTTLTLIADNSATPEAITGGTAIDLYTTAVGVPQTTLLATDRIAIRIYVTHSGRTITLHTEDSHLCQVITTFSTGITALNGLTDQIQYFATPGTSGTAPSWNSVSPNHTLNIPLASTASVTAGLISNTDYTTFSGKLSTTLNSANIFVGNGSNVATGVAMSGDTTIANTGAVTIANNAVTYAKMQAVSATSRLLGSSSTTTPVQEITVGSGLTLTGTTLTASSSVTPAALTKVDDTNVTLTLGGTPSTALLQATSITAGWTGTLADARIASAATWNAKQSAITLTTLGTSGAATFAANTLNIPQYASGGAGALYKSTVDSVGFLSIVNTAVYTQLIPANTYGVGDILRVTYRSRKTGTAGIQSMRIYVNATADLLGTPILVGQYRGVAVNTIFQMIRHLVIKSSTANTEVLSSATTVSTTDYAQDVPSTLVIDWTAAKYFVFALQNSSALDTNYGSMFLIEKL